MEFAALDPADRTDRFERDEGGPTTKSSHPHRLPVAGRADMGVGC